MLSVHMTEAEAARNLPAVLEKVQRGVEVVIERDNQAVAIIRAPVAQGRMISSVIAGLEASGARAVIDEDFARDVEEVVKSHRTRASWWPRNAAS